MDLQRSPLLTVLMRVYNAEDHVHEAIRSVLLQGFVDFELLIVEGASSDRSGEIVRSFSDYRIRIVPQTGLGKNDALACGLAAARGLYLAIQDADDLSLPNRFARQVSALNGDADMVIVGSWVSIIEKRGAEIGVRTYPLDDAAIRRAMALYNPFAHSAVMFRLAPARACGGYTDTQVLEDYDFYPRLLAYGTCANLPEVLTAYRLHTYATAQHVKFILKATLDTKWKMHTVYGYRWTFRSVAVFCSQWLMQLLPSRVVNVLFRIIFIKRRR